jgi:predicted transcriptional regulator
VTPPPATPATILQGGRAKAYRPLPDAKRRAALRAGLAAYRRGDFFEAHELLEPAWMGTADLAERELHQGLIKVAAAFVHAVRGNQAGVRKNLTGARARLADARDAGAATNIDLVALIADVDAGLARIDAGDRVEPEDAPRIRTVRPRRGAR